MNPAIERANENLTNRGDLPLPKRLTLHGLRHTFASLLVALGEDPRYVMGQLGHTDPAFTLRLYTHSMRREDDERARLQALVDGVGWAPAGTSLKTERHAPPQRPAAESGKPRRSRAFHQRARQDSNLRPLAPEASALSTELRARGADGGCAEVRRPTPS